MSKVEDEAIRLEGEAILRSKGFSEPDIKKVTAYMDGGWHLFALENVNKKHCEYLKKRKDGQTIAIYDATGYTYAQGIEFYKWTMFHLKGLIECSKVMGCDTTKEEDMLQQCRVERIALNNREKLRRLQTK